MYNDILKFSSRLIQLINKNKNIDIITQQLRSAYMYADFGFKDIQGVSAEELLVYIDKFLDNPKKPIIINYRLAILPSEGLNYLGRLTSNQILFAKYLNKNQLIKVIEESEEFKDLDSGIIMKSRHEQKVLEEAFKYLDKKDVMQFVDSESYFISNYAKRRLNLNKLATEDIVRKQLESANILDDYILLHFTNLENLQVNIDKFLEKLEPVVINHTLAIVPMKIEQEGKKYIGMLTDNQLIFMQYLNDKQLIEIIKEFEDYTSTGNVATYHEQNVVEDAFVYLSKKEVEQFINSESNSVWYLSRKRLGLLKKTMVEDIIEEMDG